MADHRRSLAIALAKDIQVKAENLALYLETDHHQLQSNKEPILEAQLPAATGSGEQLHKIVNDCNRCRKLEDELKALKIELLAKNTQFADIRNKEIQIRRVAKKYKDSFFELKSKMENSLRIEESMESSKSESVVEMGKLESLPNQTSHAVIPVDNDRKRHREPENDDGTTNKLAC